jgi:CRP-like cAMP-binding protein
MQRAEHMMEGSASPKLNRLLGLLPDDVYSRLSPDLQFIDYPVGETLHEPGEVLRYAVFPVSGLVARVGMTEEGKSCQLSLCGRDGLMGVSMILGGRPLSVLAPVLAHMTAYRLPTAAAQAVWRDSKPFQWLMLRYLHAMIEETMQVALCNRHHNVEQQLSRWLLLAMDRLGRPDIQITQATISQLLGVRREGVTEAAGKLEALAVVQRERGGIKIVNRTALRSRCCECYGATVRIFEEMFADAKRRACAGDDRGER